MNIYKEHGVAGNDKASKAGLATYTIEEISVFPLTLPPNGTSAICMPFNVILPEGVHAYDMTVTDIGYNNSKNEYTCTMRAIAGPGETLKGGTPAIIKGDVLGKVAAYLNEMNNNYRVFKFLVTNDGDLLLNACVVSKDDNFDPALVNAIIAETVKFLEAEYASIMAKIWKEIE
jgi:hypothetical protein